MSLTPDIMNDPGPAGEPSANLNPMASGTRQDFSNDQASGGGSSAGSSGAGSATDGSQYAANWNDYSNDLGNYDSDPSMAGMNAIQQLDAANKYVIDPTTGQVFGGDMMSNNDSTNNSYGTLNSTNAAVSNAAENADTAWLKANGHPNAQPMYVFNPDGSEKSMSYGFSQGGAVPGTDDDSNSDSGGGDQLQSAIQQALNTVDGVLAFGYKLHGLGGDDSDASSAQPQQQAANMPTAPASQSNSGMPQQPPGPGTLPPTSNPFGQRTVRPPLQMSSNDAAAPAIPDTDDSDDSNSQESS